MMELFSEFSLMQWVILMLGAVLIGINKTAIPGLGVLPVLMLTMTFETRMSTGLQLGMLALADLIAVAYYRRSADWKILLKLLPWALIGIAIGSLLLRYVIPDNSAAMRKTVGIVVLALAIFGYLRRRFAPDKLPDSLGMTSFFGIMLGTTTQIANAAGPISSVYLLAMKLPKEKYLGCCAWFFLTLNWIKLPIFAMEGRITWQSIQMDLCMIPFLLAGGAAGIFLLRKMPQKLFENIIQALVFIAAIKLLF